VDFNFKVRERHCWCVKQTSVSHLEILICQPVLVVVVLLLVAVGYDLMWIVTFKLSGDVLQTYITDFNSNTTTSSTAYCTTSITAVTINIAS
jgi:hypothetical protein